MISVSYGGLDLLSLYRELGTATAVAERVGVSLPTVCKRLHECGVELRRGRIPLGAQDKTRETAIVAAYRSGRTLRSVGEAFGITGERVRQIIARHEQANDTPKMRNSYRVSLEQRLCQRPDCGRLFAAHPWSRKKYCSRNCAHADLRAQRRLMLPLDAMAEDYRNGMTFQDVGEKYGVSAMTAHRRVTSVEPSRGRGWTKGRPRR